MKYLGIISIPVHIISGFLGSGKTTLMNRILGTLPTSLNAAVIVNDFGEIPLDGELIDRGDYALKELPSGCVCCTLKGPLAEALVQLAEEQDSDAIIMETTGVAIPAQIVVNFHSTALRDLVHVGNAVCVVDTCSFLKYEPHFVVLGKQAQQANTILLNKTDLVSPSALAAARNRIEYLRQPESLLVETDHCRIDTSMILRERPVFLPVVSRHEPHDHAFHSFSFETEAILSFGRLEAFLKELGDQIPRAKGIVRTNRGTKLVQLTLSGYELADWTGETETSRFVCIGEHLEPEVLKEKFNRVFLSGA